jgi:hypothetical protein
MATEASDEPKARNRAKTELFDVFRRSDDGSFVLVATSVEVMARGEAERRRLAIAMATDEDTEDQKSGTFATVLSGEFVTMTRKRKVEPVDEWSS